MKSSSSILPNHKRKVDLFLNRCKIIWRLSGSELVVWIIGLFYLIFFNIPGESHFTVCPLSNLGLEFCPGCGLGNSISFLFRGDFISSFHSHPLGIFTFTIIFLRIINIIKNNWRSYA